MSKPQQPLDDDILNPKVNASALDFLLIELVPLAQRITEQILAREQALIDEYKRSKIFNTSAKTNSTTNGIAQPSRDGAPPTTVTDGSVQDSTTGSAGEGITSLGFHAVDDEAREGMFWRLDGLGYRVGQGLVER